LRGGGGRGDARNEQTSDRCKNGRHFPVKTPRGRRKVAGRRKGQKQGGKKRMNTERSKYFQQIQSGFQKTKAPAPSVGQPRTSRGGENGKKTQEPLYKARTRNLWKMGQGKTDTMSCREGKKSGGLGGNANNGGDSTPCLRSKHKVRGRKKNGKACHGREGKNNAEKKKESRGYLNENGLQSGR